MLVESHVWNWAAASVMQFSMIGMEDVQIMTVKRCFALILGFISYIYSS